MKIAAPMTRRGDQVRGLAREVRGRIGTVLAIERYCQEEQLTVYFVLWGREVYAMFGHEVEQMAEISTELPPALERNLGDGRSVYLLPLLPGGARLAIGPTGQPWYDDVW